VPDWASVESNTWRMCGDIMSHRALTKDEEAPRPVEKSRAARMFDDKFLPHWGMLAVALMYLGFNLAVGVAGVPPTISLGFSATLGLWFNYLIRQRTGEKDGD
jgi:hypothetical protein